MALDLPPTRIAYLQLKEEQEAMGEGYRFLDEKRLILAAEILAELQRYQGTLRRLPRRLCPGRPSTFSPFPRNN